jgi:hypothetical protein
MPLVTPSAAGWVAEARRPSGPTRTRSGTSATPHPQRAEPHPSSAGACSKWPPSPLVSPTLRPALYHSRPRHQLSNRCRPRPLPGLHSGVSPPTASLSPVQTNPLRSRPRSAAATSPLPPRSLPYRTPPALPLRKKVRLARSPAPLLLPLPAMLPRALRRLGRTSSRPGRGRDALPPLKAPPPQWTLLLARRLAIPLPPLPLASPLLSALGMDRALRLALVTLLEERATSKQATLLQPRYFRRSAAGRAAMVQLLQ